MEKMNMKELEQEMMEKIVGGYSAEYYTEKVRSYAAAIIPVAKSQGMTFDKWVGSLNSWLQQYTDLLRECWFE